MVNLLSHLYKQNHLDKLSTVTMTKQNNIDLNLDINISPKLILQFFKATSWHILFPFHTSFPIVQSKLFFQVPKMLQIFLVRLNFGSRQAFSPERSIPRGMYVDGEM